MLVMHPSGKLTTPSLPVHNEHQQDTFTVRVGTHSNTISIYLWGMGHCFAWQVTHPMCLFIYCAKVNVTALSKLSENFHYNGNYFWE
jgi:hypothetical protein